MKERIVQQPMAGGVQAKFSDLPTADVERSTFDMSHPWKGTMNTNAIVPILNQEILPGDTFNIKSTVFMRLATPLKPIMDSLSADIHYFFVPNRLLWDNWQRFMGERITTDDDPNNFSVPQADVQLDINQASQSVQDYFGLPLTTVPLIKQFNALPFRAYKLVFNEWYRNQNITDPFDVPTDDGPDDLTNVFSYGTAPRHKKGDYFTRALPWPQKGDPVFLPLGTYAPVNRGPEPFSFDLQPTFQKTGETQIDTIGLSNTGDATGAKWQTMTSSGAAFEPVQWYEPKLHADLTSATAASINDIRTAFQIQRLLERDARGGTRYIEILLSHFNVQSPDFRLQRPEYLGGGNARIIVNPIAQTVPLEGSPQGNLAAVGTGLVKGGCTHSFTEHGILLGLISCRADATYQTGVDRMWSRKTRYDFYWPALSHLGEQAILNKELYFTGTDAADDGIWGYQERYGEYRYQPGRVTGKFRSRDPQSLDVWHLSQDFDALPPLDTAFVLENPPIDRVVAVPGEPDLIVDVWHDMQATRPMPVYAVPGLVDHF